MQPSSMRATPTNQWALFNFDIQTVTNKTRHGAIVTVWLLMRRVSHL